MVNRRRKNREVRRKSKEEEGRTSPKKILTCPENPDIKE
jgi:hypothetical protein